MADQPETTTSSSSSAPPPEPDKKPPQVGGGGGGGFYPSGEGGFQMMMPFMYPTLIPAADANLGGAGVYAVPAGPFMGPTVGNQLIPLTYNIPTRPPAEAGATGDNGHGGQQQHQANQQRQVVVRRFQIVFQLDLLLILKLAAVIFLFNQDGSSQRLVVLVLVASLVYLYQTGALAPLVRWLSQSMQRAAAPPRPPRPAREENAPLVPRQNGDDAVAGEGIPDGQAGAEGENRPADNGNQAGENENLADHGAENGGNQWWGIVKEIQMIIFGFITSLLPGFHNID